MPLTAAELQEKIDKFVVNMGRFDTILNGDEDTVVTVDGALNVPSVSNTLSRIRGILKPTYAGLAAIVGQFDGQVALVPPSDGGSHTDPVVGGTVLNTGIFTWVASGPNTVKWQRVGNYADIGTLQDDIDALELAMSDQQKLGANIASAATVDLGAATGEIVQITGNETITSLGNAARAGIWRIVRFTGTPVLVHSATLVLPYAVDITVQSNDRALFVALNTTGTWMCMFWSRQNASAIRSDISLGDQQILGTTIPAASTIELGASTGETVQVSGSATITSLGTGVTNGRWRRVIFHGACTLVNSANILLPNGENITTSAWDCATFVHIAGNVWICTDYIKYGEIAIKAMIDSLAVDIGDVITDLAAEVVARSDADDALSDDIAAEALARTNADTALDNAMVHKIGDEIVAGKKTFSDTIGVVAYEPSYAAAESRSLLKVTENDFILQAYSVEEEYTTDEPGERIVVSADGYIIEEGIKSAIEPIANSHNVLRIKQKLRMILAGENQVCRMGCIGDSWFASIGPVWFRNRMVSIYGDAGPGWVNLATSNSNRCADSRVVRGTIGGTWTDIIGYEPMPSTTAMQTSEVDAYIPIFGVGPIATTYLHYVASTGSLASYRWGTYDGSGDPYDRTNYVWGSDHAINLETGYRISLPTDIPSGIGATDRWGVEVKCVGGTVKVGGLDMLNGQKGVVVDSLAKGGSNSLFWLIPDSAKWITAYGSLNTDGTFVLLGTNDQAGTESDWKIAVNMDRIRQRILLAEPASQVIYMSPCENFLGRPRSIKAIAEALREYAKDTETTHIYLQPFFGPIAKMDEYRSTGVRPLFNADDVHPDSFTGMYVIANVMEDLII